MSKAWIRTSDHLLLCANESSFAVFPFGSAITRLIYGITHEFGDERFRFLRQRIFSQCHLNIWDQNLVKVCAKRASQASTLDLMAIPEHKLLDLGRDLEADPLAMRHAGLIGRKIGRDEALRLVSTIALDERRKARSNSLKLHQAHRPIAAIICNADDEILGIAVNTNADCQIRHAEVNLILHLAASGVTTLPAGSKFYTSLKPCRMCAALILSYGRPTENSGPSTVQVIAAEDDPGTFGRHHLLDGILEIKQTPSHR